MKKLTDKIVRAMSRPELKKHLVEHDLVIYNRIRRNKNKLIAATVKELKRLAKLAPKKFIPGKSSLEGIKHMVWEQDLGPYILDQLNIMSYEGDNIGDLPRAEALYDGYSKEAFYKYGYSQLEIEKIFND